MSALVTVGWANGFIINPTLIDKNVGLRKARSPTYVTFIGCAER